MTKIELPKEVAELYRIVEKLEAQYPGRKFTLDGHLVGSIGEVIAERVFDLKLYPPSNPIHDGRTPEGKEVQIKLTGGKKIGLREEPNFLLVLRIVDPTHAEVVYNGPGLVPWNSANKMQKNGQRSLSLTKLKMFNEKVSEKNRIR